MKRKPKIEVEELNDFISKSNTSPKNIETDIVASHKDDLKKMLDCSNERLAINLEELDSSKTNTTAELKLNNEPELTTKMNFINQDIDKLVPYAQSSLQIKQNESKLFQVEIEQSSTFLVREAQIVWTIKDIGLDPGYFFSDRSNNICDEIIIHNFIRE